MIDVFEQIKPFLRFESEDDFYFLQILQRKKENPEIGSNSRVIKNYYITSLPYLEERYEEIKYLCQTFNARASLRLNKRSFKKVAFKALQNIANTMANGEYSALPKAYDRACGDGHNDSQKKWIVDIDDKDGHYLVFLNEDKEKFVTSLCEFINQCQPLGEEKILAQLPTKSGLHLITKPFDLAQFKLKYQIDIHKDNPINLYIP